MEKLTIFDLYDINKIDNVLNFWNNLSKNFKNAIIYYHEQYPFNANSVEFCIITEECSELIQHSSKVLQKSNIILKPGYPENFDNIKGVISEKGCLIFIESDSFTYIFKDQTININKSKNLLNNNKFLSNASEDLILKEKTKLNDFIDKQNLKLINDLFNKYKENFVKYINKYTLEEIISYIQYEREKIYIGEEYSPDWFDYIYNPDIIDDFSLLTII